MIEVNIRKKKFNPQKIIKLIEKEKNYGALVSFIGSVRENTKDGKKCRNISKCKRCSRGS